MSEERKRWFVTASYEAKPMPYVHMFEIEELSELQTEIERGPDWNALKSITITYAIRHPQETTNG